MAGGLKNQVYKKQFVVQIEGLGETYFQKATAPKDTYDKVKYSDGQTGVERIHVGMLSRNEVTLSKVYEASKDKAVITWYQGLKKEAVKPFSVTITPVEVDLAGTPISGGVKITLTGCQVSAFAYPECDRNGNDMAMLEIVIVYDDYSIS